MDFKGKWRREGMMGRGSGRKVGERERERKKGEKRRGEEKEKINHFYDFGKYSRPHID